MLLFIPSFSHSITPDCTTPDDALKEVLSHEIIQTIASLSSEVLSRCPQATCRVIRIGRSPTTIVAYFQSQYHKYNWNILLGDSRYGVKYEPLHKDFKLKLFNHFRGYLPDESTDQRNVLVLDYGASDESLVAASSYLKKFFANSPSEIKIRPHLISSHLISSKTGFQNRETHPLLTRAIGVHPKHPLFHALDNQLFDEYAEFGSYKITDPVQIKEEHKSNPKYLALIHRFKEVIAEFAFTSKTLSLDPSSLAYTVMKSNIPAGFLKSSWKIEDLEEAREVLAFVQWLATESQIQYFDRFFDVPSFKATLCKNLAYYKGETGLNSTSSSTLSTGRNMEHYLSQCLFHSNEEIKTLAYSTISEISTYARAVGVYDQAFELVLKKEKREIHKQVMVSALQYYVGAHAKEFFTQSLTDSNPSIVQFAKKSLIYYAQGLDQKQNGTAAIPFIASLISGDEEMGSIIQDTFSLRNRRWELNPTIVDSEEYIDLTTSSESSDSPLLALLPREPETPEKTIRRFIKKVSKSLRSDPNKTRKLRHSERSDHRKTRKQTGFFNS